MIFRRVGFQQLFQRHCLGNVVFPGSGTPQGFHAAAAAQRLADVLAEGADIGALGAVHPQLQAAILHAQVFQRVDGDGAGLPLHGFAPARQVAELLAVHLQGGIHGRDLQDVAPEGLQGGLDLFAVQRHRVSFQHRAGDVLGIGDKPGAQQGDVFLPGVLEELHPPGGSAHKHGQHPGGHGVEGAAVADPASAVHPAQPGGHILARPAPGLVDDYNSVHFFSCEKRWSRFFCRAHRSALQGQGTKPRVFMLP